jgi:hypothetical protein
MHLRREQAFWAIAAALASSTPDPALADEDPYALQVHGFVSQGWIKTSANNYLGKTERSQGSFEFSEVGINFTKPLSDRFRIGLQIFTHDLGQLGNYAPQLDWYYLDYRVADWLGIRAGKTKLPFGLYNESNDIDAGRVPVILPQSVYPVSSREFLFAQTGVELYGDLPLGDAGSVEYRLYGGTIFLNPADSSDQLKDFDVPYEGGGRLMWHPPFEGLQLGASAQILRLEFAFTPTPEQRTGYEASGQLPMGSSGDVVAALPAKLWVASVEYQREGLLLAAEYARTYVRYETNLLLPQTKVVAQGGYLLASYQLAPWFTPGLYYSAFFPDIHAVRPPGTEQSPRSSYQHDIALSTRYDITPNWLLKLEAHYMHGTAGLQSALNGGQSRDELTEDWGVFLAKTTGYF